MENTNYANCLVSKGKNISLEENYATNYHIRTISLLHMGVSFVTWKVVHEYLRRHGGGGSRSNVNGGGDRNEGRSSDFSTIPVSHILTRQADLAGPRGPSYVRSEL